MNVFPKRVAALTLAVGLGLPLAAHATNGMFMIGFGAKAEAVGGAAIAFPQDAMAGAVNPAAITWIDASTMRIDVGGELFLPDAEASFNQGVSGDGVQGTSMTQTSRANTFLIPNMGGAMKFNRKITMGMTAVGAGGGGSRYNTNLYNAMNRLDPSVPVSTESHTLGVSLMLMQVNPTISFKLNKQNSVGGSLIMGLQQFRAFGLGDNFGFAANCTDGTKSESCLSNKGNDYSYGAGLRLGWMGRFLDQRLNLGAAASSRVYMTQFTRYNGLFPDHGDLDTPPMLGAGMAYKVNDDLDVAFDITRTFYEEVNAIANKGPDPNSLTGLSCQLGLPGKGSCGFGWRNQTVYKLGMAYKWNDDLTLRAGWNYGKSPIPENDAIIFNFVAPAVTEHHLTLGGTYHLGPGPMGTDAEMSFVYVHAFEFEQFGPTYLTNQETGQSGFGKIGMSQNAFGVSIGLKM